MTNEKHPWIYDILFVLVLLLAGYLRLGGIEWGEGYHQHPDELFLMGVLDSLRAQTCAEPTDTFVDACAPENRRWMTPLEYFDSAKSTLNPYNRGYGFFVYGNLPMTLTRVLMEAMDKDDLGQSKFFARQMSAVADLFAIFFLYLLVSRLYGRKVGLLSAAFSALAVMQIQQSHYFTSDLFVNTFLFLALLCAVGILEWKGEVISDKDKVTSDESEVASNEGQETSNEDPLPTRNSATRYAFLAPVVKHHLFLLSIGFGFALGMGMASKI